MKKINYLLFILLMFFLAHYSDAQGVDSTTLNSASLTGIVTLNGNTTYIMKGYNRVKNGATLIINSGALILGDKVSNGTLIIERGGKINAVGTVDKPITFTSRFAPSQRNPGDWGGILILGRSGINTPTGIDSAKIEGLPTEQETWYGGQPVVNDDSSGVMKYVRIEFAGVPLTPGNEINGLTCGGVGSRTVLDYIQVSYSGDDAFEFFGGNVNLTHAIAFGTVDDDLDCDNGHRGRIQFALIVRDSAKYDVSASHMFEIDNNANSPFNYNSPRTKTVFSNITAVGPNSYSNPYFLRGAHLRRNMLASIFNTIMMAYPKGVRFDGPGVGNACNGDTIRLRNNIFVNFPTALADTAGGIGSSGFTNGAAWLQTGSYANRVFATNAEVMLNNPFNIYPLPPVPANNISFWMPSAGSPALTGASFIDPLLANFETTTYVGAFGSTNWTAGWANFNPKEYTPTPIGVQKISNEVPGIFELSQNYPNPFNPSTSINYAIPVSGLVRIAVYNAIGKEINTLVNEMQHAGSYKATFDASNLPSGVYFYKITVYNSKSVEWSQTKKMILVK